MKRRFSAKSKKLIKSSCIESKCSLELEKKSPCDESQSSLKHEILVLHSRLQAERSRASHAEKIASLKEEVLGLRAAIAIIPKERALGNGVILQSILSYLPSCDHIDALMALSRRGTLRPSIESLRRMKTEQNVSLLAKHCIGSYTWCFRGEVLREEELHGDFHGNEYYGLPCNIRSKSNFLVANQLKYAKRSRHPGIPGSETDELVFHADNSGATLVGFRIGTREVDAVRVLWSDIILADSNASFYCYIYTDIWSTEFNFNLSDDFDSLLEKISNDSLSCEASKLRHTITVHMSIKLLIKRVPQLGVTLGLNYK